MTKQRIGYDARFINDQYHGIGRYAYNILEGATRIDNGTTYVVFYNPELVNTRFDLATVLNRPNVEAKQTDAHPYTIREQFALPRAAKKAGIDLWYSPYFWFPLLMGSPVVNTGTDLIFETYPQYMPNQRQYWLYRVMLQLSLSRASHMLTISRATTQGMLNHYWVDPSKLSEMMLAIDHRRYNNEIPQEKIDEVRARYDLPEKFILNVGTRRPHKNVGVLVEAFARITHKVDVDLVLAGPADARYPDVAMQHVENLGLAKRVHTTEFVEEDDMPALYAAAELFVFPSLIEGFGLPILEAMACGTPVITSDRTSMPEIAGHAAALVSPNMAAHLADSMLEMLTNPEEKAKFSQLGLMRAAKFRWDKSAETALAAWHNLLAGNGHMASQAITPSTGE